MLPVFKNFKKLTYNNTNSSTNQIDFLLYTLEAPSLIFILPKTITGYAQSGQFINRPGPEIRLDRNIAGSATALVRDPIFATGSSFGFFVNTESVIGSQGDEIRVSKPQNSTFICDIYIFELPDEVL